MGLLFASLPPRELAEWNSAYSTTSYDFFTNSFGDLISIRCIDSKFDAGRQRFAQPIEFLHANGILKTRQRRLRGQIAARARIAVQ